MTEIKLQKIIAGEIKMHEYLMGMWQVACFRIIGGGEPPSPLFTRPQMKKEMSLVLRVEYYDISICNIKEQWKIVKGRWRMIMVS